MRRYFLFILLIAALSAQQGADFLIITYDEFAPIVNQLAEWKNARGILTKVVKLTEIPPYVPNPTKEQIRDYVINAYNTWTPSPKYLLLVGATDYIPHFQASPAISASDNSYGDMTGDYRLEIAVGRFPAYNSTECQIMVAKTIAFENINSLQAPDWYKKATLIVNETPEAPPPYPEPYWFTINYAYNQLVSHGFSAIELVHWADCTGDDYLDVISAINDGCVFVAYRGISPSHTQWGAPFGFSPNLLSNYWKLPIVISGTCWTAAFNAANAMCNTWMRAGTLQNPTGAVAFLGTSTVGSGNDISWSRGYAAKGFFRAVFEENTYTLGDAFVSAKNYMADNHLNPEAPQYPYTDLVEQEYKGWSLIGDPALQILGPVTNDPLSLAYNGNRHLARRPNTQELHLTYTDRGKVIYRYSSNGGTDWTLPKIVGDGGFPAVALNSNNLPVIAWNDNWGQLWYSRQIDPQQNTWAEPYLLYAPSGAREFSISPPSVVVTSHPTPGVDTTHILFSPSILYEVSPNGNNTWVYEYSFPHTDPSQLTIRTLYLDLTWRPIPPFPSITRDFNQTLHAVWNWEYTIFYATRQVGQQWQNWGWQFGTEGLQSAHPFVECYGDMVYVVWEHKESPTSPEDVWKAGNRIYNPTPQFTWENLSRTPNTPSRYPVNASGLFTVFQDSPYPPINGPEVYYKVHPEDEPYNISQTIPSSRYPQSVARFVGTRTYLYTAWQDGDNVPYEIKFKKLQYIPMELPAPAYLTSINGNEIPSPYLVARDSFISNWQIPVDIGYQTITYRFPLEPGYRYRIKVITYHESSGQWREKVKIDNKLQHLIKYNAYEPETLEFWIPPAFYKDGKIDVVFERISGDFATAGPIYIYQYEYEEETMEFSSGPMAQEGQPLRNGITVFPNPFKANLNISFNVLTGNRINLKIYDISGRLVKQFNNPSEKIIWDGRDEYGRKVTPGVYFLKVDNPDTKQTFTHKLIKLE